MLDEGIVEIAGLRTAGYCRSGFLFWAMEVADEAVLERCRLQKLQEIVLNAGRARYNRAAHNPGCF